MAKIQSAILEKICADPNCPKQGQPQPIENFYNITKHKDGKDTKCKECRSKYNKQIRNKNAKKPPITKDTKICSNPKCDKTGLLQPISNFALNPSRKDGRNNWCKSCINKLGKEIYYRDLEKQKKKSKKYRDENPEKVSAKSKEWRLKNLARDLATKKIWREANPDYKRAEASNRRAIQIKSTPPWAKEMMKDYMKLISKFAIALSKQKEEKYHIDHIIPLNGKNVKGLHLPWNLQLISWKENLKKSNKILIN